MRILKPVVALLLIVSLSFMYGCSSGSDEEEPGNNDNSSSSSSSSGGVPARTTTHPPGFAVPAVHSEALAKGQDAEGRLLDCRACHGTDLTGNIAPSCDSCHGPGGQAGTAWRTDCTFCHGGSEDASGAPPRYLSGDNTPGTDIFPAHQAHVNSSITANLGCTQCHRQVLNVLTENHAFDSTPGKADVDMSNGFSPQAEFAPETGCTNSYCHGGGRDDQGKIGMLETDLACSSCHPAVFSGEAEWQIMSGFHSLHLNSAIEMSCRDCHNAVTGDNVTITNSALHVNNQRDIAFSQATISFDQQNISCSGSCHGVSHAFPWSGNAGGGGGVDGGSFHPEGFENPDQHGVEMVLQRSDCRGCHGAQLQGDLGNSCDQCHGEGGGQGTEWRTDCTFCHGGLENNTGAPPRDLGARELGEAQSFQGHTAHVQEEGGDFAAAMGCNQCHKVPSDVLSEDHAFDASPNGVAELNFSQSLSAATTYNEQTCSNSYCHGNGQGDNGTVTDGEIMNCDSCHASIESGANAWSGMSGFHSLHLSSGENMACSDCHNQVTTDNLSIANIQLHVNGDNNVVFSEDTLNFDPNNVSCDGVCHAKEHPNYSWGSSGGAGGEAYHPEGFEDPSQHGVEMVLQAQNCTSCHGEDLTGGIGNSCDQCHGPGGSEGTDWRTNCTFCHGGTDNNTGAPPHDLGGEEVNLSFAAHTAHVESNFSSPIACNQCHVNPANVLSDNHAFDATPGGEAEADFTQGISPATVFNSEALSCSNSYCHGNGQGDNGTVALGETMNCQSCHQENNLGGEHPEHRGGGIDCGDCHLGVSIDGQSLVNPALHINKEFDIEFRESDSITINQANTCSGRCHGVFHTNFRW